MKGTPVTDSGHRLGCLGTRGKGLEDPVRKRSAAWRRLARGPARGLKCLVNSPAALGRCHTLEMLSCTPDAGHLFWGVSGFIDRSAEVKTHCAPGAEEHMWQGSSGILLRWPDMKGCLASRSGDGIAWFEETTSVGRSSCSRLHPTFQSVLRFFKYLFQGCRELPASRLQGAWPFPCRPQARHTPDQKPAIVWQTLHVLRVRSWWLVLAAGRQADRPSC